MNEDYQIAQAIIQVVGFLGGVFFAVSRIVAKTEMLSHDIAGLAEEIKTLRKSLNHIWESHQDHSLRIVRLETVLNKNSNHRQ